jgi:hypothetical protein
MKLSLTRGPRRALTRSEAWACLSANLALPGAGSLTAGQAVGYVQMALAFLGVIVTLVTTIPMIRWVLSTSGGSQPPMSDPYESLLNLWRHARWPLAGMGIFAVAILWAMATSLVLLSGAQNDAAPPRIPPILPKAEG